MEEKSTSERLNEILPQLSKDQLRYIVALQDCPSKKEACDAIGIKPNTVYKWDAIVDEAARLMALEAVDGARAIRRRNLVKAMMIKAGGLDSDNEVVRQKAATEIIEWEMGQAAQPITGKDGEALIPKTPDGERLERMKQLAVLIAEEVKKDA